MQTITISIVALAAAMIAQEVKIHTMRMQIDNCFYLLNKCITQYCKQGTAFVEMQETLAKLDTTYKSAINTLEDQIKELEHEMHSPYYGGPEPEDPEGEVMSND